MKSRRVLWAAILIVLLAAIHVGFYQYITHHITLLAWDEEANVDRALRLRLGLQAPVLFDLGVIGILLIAVVQLTNRAREAQKLRDHNAMLRKALEKERSLSGPESRVQAIFDQVPAALVLFDAEGHLLMANPKAINLLNLDDRLIGDIKFADLLPPQAIIRFADLSRALAERGPQSIRISLNQNKGIDFEARLRMASFVNQKNGENLVVGTVEPIEEPEPEDAPEMADRPAVLVADDEELLRILMKNMLIQMGYRPLLARDGQEAVELFTAHRKHIAAVILDMVMPRLDGPEAAERIRALAPAMPILYCSGLTQLPSHAPEDQRDRLVRKPFSIEDFKIALQTVLEERPEGAAPADDTAPKQ